MTLLNAPSTVSSIQLVIFDCDGVLIDSEILSKRVLLKMLGELGISVSDDYFDTYFLGHSYKSVKAQILTDFAVNLTDQFRQDYQDSLLQTFAKELVSTTHLHAMLTNLKTPCCVATSSSPTRVKFALDTIGLHDFFKGRIFTSSEVKKGKPAPDIFLHSALKMGVSPKHCLVIEDSQAGIQAAQSADMRVIRYAGASHLKDKAISSAGQTRMVHTIFHWKELYELYPSIALKNSIRGG